MKDELQQHKRSDKVKWIITGIVLILLLVTVAGLGVQLFRKEQLKPPEWIVVSGPEASEAGTLYYNIDVGYTDESATPPDDSRDIGKKQSTTRDMPFHYDALSGTNWGYLGEYNAVNWENDSLNEWSVREGKDGELTYVMTGFVANEALTIETGGHLNHGWDERTFNVECNGVVAGTISLPSSTDRVYKAFPCSADENGVLTVIFKGTQSGNPQVGYIKIYAGALEEETEGEVTESYAASVTPKARNAVSAYAVSVTSEERETVKRSVFSTTNDLTFGSHPSLYGYMKGLAVGYAGFEYVIGFPLRWEYNPTSVCGMYIGVSTGRLDSAGNPLPAENIDFSINAGGSYDYFLQLAVGENYSYQYTPDICSINDGLFLTLTNERAIISYYPSALGTWVSEKGEYKDSLSKYTLATFGKDTGEYETIRRICLNTYSEICWYSWDTDEHDWGSIYESVNFYNYVEIPKKEGYTFTGWYYDEACTQKCGDEVVDESVTLYPGYEINKYTVTYVASTMSEDPNEFGLYDRVDKVEYGGIANYVPPAVEGVEFLGWLYEDGTEYNDTPITHDVTLYAQWGKTTYTVVLNYNGGTSESGNVFTVERGSLFMLPEVVREGFRLIGWRYMTNDERLGQFCYDMHFYSDTKLQAVWEALRYTVTLYVDEEIYKQLEVYYGEELASGEVDTSLKEGYTLVGWYYGEKCEGDEDCEKYDFTPIHEDTVLHGHFEISRYSVTFYVKGEIREKKTVEHGTSYSVVSGFADDMGLRIVSLYASDAGSLSSDYVSCNLGIEAEELSGIDKAMYIAEKNKWKVIGGVAGGLVLLALLFSLLSMPSRREK